MIACTLLISLVLCSCSFKGSREYREALEGEYNTGYEQGYEQGYKDARKQIFNHLDSENFDIECEGDIRIIENYADGEPISQEDLVKAIWTVSRYYYAVNDLIAGIEDFYP